MIAPKAIALSLLLKKSLALSLWLSKDPVRDSIQGQIDHFSRLSSWSVAIVAVGVVLELIEVIHDSVAWIKRKRREKRERAEWESLSTVFPVGKMKAERESHIDHPKWVKHCLRFGIVAVALGVIGEYEYGTELEDAHNAMHEYDVRKLTGADQKAGDAAASARTAHQEADAVKGIADEARADAKDALEKAKVAQRELEHAEADAAKAQKVASRALSTADKAESQIADALQRAANSEAELKLLRMPRSLAHRDELIAALKPFNGTEYTLNVFMDDESNQFTKIVAGALDAAGWVRKQPAGMNLGIPTMRIDFGQGDVQNVPACIDTGISLHAYAKESLTVLQSRPSQSLPKQVQAALALQSAIALSIFPPNDRNVVSGILDPKPAEGVPIAICVGKKP